MSKKSLSSYVLLGFVLVVSALVVSAILIPGCGPPSDRSRRKRAIADIKVVSDALQVYRARTEYPKSNRQLRPISFLDASLTPSPLRILPSRDGWGRDYGYWSDGEHFVLLSLGSHPAAATFFLDLLNSYRFDGKTVCSAARGYASNVWVVVDGEPCEELQSHMSGRVHR